MTHILIVKVSTVSSKLFYVCERALASAKFRTTYICISAGITDHGNDRNA